MIYDSLFLFFYKWVILIPYTIRILIYIYMFLKTSVALAALGAAGRSLAARQLAWDARKVTHELKQVLRLKVYIDVCNS